MAKKIVSLMLVFIFSFTQLGFAQVAVDLNLASHMGVLGSRLSVEKFRLPHLRYFSYDLPSNSINLLLDKGDLKQPKDASIEASGQELLKYFFIGVSLSDDNFWVNLRPDSEDNIISGLLARTDVGKILLGADLKLKKDTARLTSPQTPNGKLYWDKLYKKAAELFGTENVSIPTLTRPWIVPGEIIIRESENSAYIYKANLRVMLEQDHLKDSAVYSFNDPRQKELNEYSSRLIRELIIPQLTKEVNNSRSYAKLRQVYYSLILARWFKSRFYGKGGTYSSYINSQNLADLTSTQSWSKTEYFKQYQDSFNKGEYNLKTPVSTLTGASIRSYFSGGADFTGKNMSFSSPISIFNVFSGKAALVPPAANTGLVHLSVPATAGNPLASVKIGSSPLGFRPSNTEGENNEEPKFPNINPEDGVIPEPEAPDRSEDESDHEDVWWDDDDSSSPIAGPEFVRKARMFDDLLRQELITRGFAVNAGGNSLVSALYLEEANKGKSILTQKASMFDATRIKDRRRLPFTISYSPNSIHVNNYDPEESNTTDAFIISWNGNAMPEVKNIISSSPLSLSKDMDFASARKAIQAALKDARGNYDYMAGIIQGYIRSKIADKDIPGFVKGILDDILKARQKASSDRNTSVQLDRVIRSLAPSILNISYTSAIYIEYSGGPGVKIGAFWWDTDMQERLAQEAIKAAASSPIVTEETIAALVDDYNKNKDLSPLLSGFKSLMPEVKESLIKVIVVPVSEKAFLPAYFVEAIDTQAPAGKYLNEASASNERYIVITSGVETIGNHTAAMLLGNRKDLGPQNCLFISSNPKEIIKAQAKDWKTVKLDRNEFKKVGNASNIVGMLAGSSPVKGIEAVAGRLDGLMKRIKNLPFKDNLAGMVLQDMIIEYKPKQKEGLVINDDSLYEIDYIISDNFNTLDAKRLISSVEANASFLKLSKDDIAGQSVIQEAKTRLAGIISDWDTIKTEISSSPIRKSAGELEEYEVSKGRQEDDDSAEEPREETDDEDLYSSLYSDDDESGSSESQQDTKDKPRQSSPIDSAKDMSLREIISIADNVAASKKEKLTAVSQLIDKYLDMRHYPSYSERYGFDDHRRMGEVLEAFYLLRASLIDIPETSELIGKLFSFYRELVKNRNDFTFRDDIPHLISALLELSKELRKQNKIIELNKNDIKLLKDDFLETADYYRSDDSGGDFVNNRQYRQVAANLLLCNKTKVEFEAVRTWHDPVWRNTRTEDLTNYEEVSSSPVQGTNTQARQSSPVINTSSPIIYNKVKKDLRKLEANFKERIEITVSCEEIKSINENWGFLTLEEQERALKIIGVSWARSRKSGLIYSEKSWLRYSEILQSIMWLLRKDKSGVLKYYMLTPEAQKGIREVVNNPYVGIPDEYKNKGSSEVSRLEILAAGYILYLGRASDNIRFPLMELGDDGYVVFDEMHKLNFPESTIKKFREFLNRIDRNSLRILARSSSPVQGNSSRGRAALTDKLIGATPGSVLHIEELKKEFRVTESQIKEAIELVNGLNEASETGMSIYSGKGLIHIPAIENSVSGSPVQQAAEVLDDIYYKRWHIVDDAGKPLLKNEIIRAIEEVISGKQERVEFKARPPKINNEINYDKKSYDIIVSLNSDRQVFWRGRLQGLNGAIVLEEGESSSGSENKVRTGIQRQQEEESSSPLNPGGINSPEEKLGGIDFRALPMTCKPMGGFCGLSFALPRPAGLASINVDKELKDINLMVERGIAPSGERVKELIAACYHKKQLVSHQEELMSCLMRICRLQEEAVQPVDNALKEALVIVDSL